MNRDVKWNLKAWLQKIYSSSSSSSSFSSSSYINEENTQVKSIRNTEFQSWNHQGSYNLHRLPGPHSSCWNSPRIVRLLPVKGHAGHVLFRGNDRDHRAPKGAGSQEELHRPGRTDGTPTTRLQCRRTLLVSSRKSLFPWIWKKLEKKVSNGQSRTSSKQQEKSYPPPPPMFRRCGMDARTNMPSLVK